MSPEVAEDAELELGLGLSIGGGGKAKPGGWREYGRILTAQDIPSLISRTASNSNAIGSVSGTKRAAAEPASQDCGGSGSPTSVRFDLSAQKTRLLRLSTTF